MPIPAGPPPASRLRPGAHTLPTCPVQHIGAFPETSRRCQVPAFVDEHASGGAGGHAPDRRFAL